MSQFRKLQVLLTGALALAVIGCGGEQATPKTESAPQPGGQATAAPGAQVPDAGGQVHRIEMITDEAGNNKFVPATIEARKGDVLRFALVVGVHNVHFLADSNPPGMTFPPPGQMLQAPGQTEDVKVTWDPGTYYFQCDPHALLGMIGHLVVK